MAIYFVKPFYSFIFLNVMQISSLSLSPVFKLPTFPIQRQVSLLISCEFFRRYSMHINVYTCYTLSLFKHISLLSTLQCILYFKKCLGGSFISVHIKFSHSLQISKIFRRCDYIQVFVSQVGRCPCDTDEETELSRGSVTCPTFIFPSSNRNRI